MECDFRNAVACLPQSWNWLEDREGKDDMVSRRMWKVMEAKVRKVRVVKAKRKEEKILVLDIYCIKSPVVLH